MKLVPVRLVCQGLLGVLLVGFCLVLAAPAVAQNQYYVNSSAGNDSNDGSQAHPWKTLQHADSAAALGSGGAVVHVADGTYTGNLTFTKSGSSDSVRFEWRCDNQNNSARSWPCKIVGTVTNNGAFSNFLGFDVTNNGLYMVVGNANFQHFQNNRVHDSSNVCTDIGGAGINVGSTVHPNLQGAVVTGNLIFNTSTGAGGWGNRCHGIYASETNVVLENNVIFNNPQGYGIKYQPNTVSNSPASVISNNTLWGNGGSRFCPSGPTPCTTGGPAGGCILLSPSASGGINPTNLSVNNNICYLNPGTFQGITFYPNDSVGAGSVLKNNVMFGNGTNAISGLASGTIFSAPNFTNFKADGSGDYTPTSSAPLKGGGSATCSSGVTTACVPTVDFAGVARLGTLDIGAFAQGSSTASSAPSAPTGLTASVQ